MTVELIPQADLLAKVTAGTAFKADADTTANSITGAGHITDLWGQFFTGSPSDLPTIDESGLSPSQLVTRYTPFLRPGMNLTGPDTTSVVSLGQQIKMSSDGLTQFDGHVTTQLADMPKNLNIFSNVTAITGNTHAAFDCSTALATFFGSIMGFAKSLLAGVNAVLSALNSAVAAAIAAVNGVLTGIANAIAAIVATVTAALRAAIKAVTDFIAAEIAALAKAVADLINYAVTGLLPSLFKDICVALLMQTSGNAITQNTASSGP